MIKKIFFDAMQARQNVVIYAVMACALLATLTIQGSIHGNLQASHFFYALITASVFIFWTIVDYKFRQLKNN